MIGDLILSLFWQHEGEAKNVFFKYLRAPFFEIFV